jgi:transposase
MDRLWWGERFFLFPLEAVMSKTRSQPRRRRRTNFVQKPNGSLAPRVQAVGPERFGIVMVDVSKERIQTQICDFYGNEIVPFTVYEQSRPGCEACLRSIQQVQADSRVLDLVVAIERTGEYHRPFQRAAQRAHYDVRIVHPLATHHFRSIAHPGNKTDPTDLGGIHRATVNGFGLIERVLPPEYAQLQLLVRHRRDLVHKQTTLCCQIQEALHAIMPGYEQCFARLWDSTLALPIARATGSAEAIVRRGVPGLAELVEHGHWPRHQTTLQQIVQWAQAAPPAHAHSDILRGVLDDLDQDRLEKNRQIRQLERRMATHLADMPFVRLLVIPGINVVSAADLGGELGPISHYANANAITGRAGHFPARYQSDEVDRADGALIRAANRRLRATLMQIADNLVTCNHYFRAKASTWRSAGKDPRWIRVKVGKIFSRIAYAILAGAGPFQHPCLHGDNYVVRKLNVFHLAHQTPVVEVLAGLRAAIAQLPHAQYAHEARPWQQDYERRQASRRGGPTPLSEIILEVLARLGVGTVESTNEGTGLG